MLDAEEAKSTPKVMLGSPGLKGGYTYSYFKQRKPCAGEAVMKNINFIFINFYRHNRQSRGELLLNSTGRD